MCHSHTYRFEVFIPGTPSRPGRTLGPSPGRSGRRRDARAVSLRGILTSTPRLRRGGDVLGSAELASWGGSTALLECCEFKLSGVGPVVEHSYAVSTPETITCTCNHAAPRGLVPSWYPSRGSHARARSFVRISVDVDFDTIPTCNTPDRTLLSWKI